jgi:hypothetical protein
MFLGEFNINKGVIDAETFEDFIGKELLQHCTLYSDSNCNSIIAVDNAFIYWIDLTICFCF